MALSDSLSPLLAEIKANPRLRLGLCAILGIAWLYGSLLLRDESQRAASEYQAFAKKVARTTAQAGQNEWLERAETAQATQLQLESRLWRESTLGLAQASFQDWLNLAVQQAGVARPALTVAAQEENPVNTKGNEQNGDLWKISAKLSFDFTQKNLYDLMTRLAGHDKQIVVETLVIRSTPALRAEMMLAAYFQKPVGALDTAGGNKDTQRARP